jgi:hypothetical protein
LLSYLSPVKIYEEYSPLLLQKGSTVTERAPKLSGSKFIKQAGSNSADSSPKAEP